MIRSATNPCLAMVFAILGMIEGRGDNLVVVWNDLALRAVRAANTPPPAAVRQMAVCHLAMHDSAAVIRGEPGVWIQDQPESSCLVETAVSEAAYLSLRTFFPKSAEMFDSHRRAIFAAIRESPEKANGMKWGAYVAKKVLQMRQFDGAGQTTAWLTNTQAGFWQRTLPNYDLPLLPGWGRMKPFAIPNLEDFRPPPPPSLDSAEWAAEYNFVKNIGATNSLSRTPTEREIALFWADGPRTETPPGHWNRIAQQVVDKNRYDLFASARLFAALNLALADAAVVCWDAKYLYNFWRPITAIRAGETDGNPNTQPDHAWLPLIITPPFPEYTSGHSTFSGAAAEVLGRMTGSDEFHFVTVSDGMPGIVRRFQRFSDAAREAGLSRLYGGIHFRSANEQGLESGRKVGAFVVESIFPASAAFGENR